MKNGSWSMRIRGFSIALILILTFVGCTTFDVKAPRGMFISTGDYVPEVETMGILQVNRTQLAFLFFFDINAIRQNMYEELIDKAQNVNADGLTNVVFYWKLSPLTWVTTFIFSGVYDFYMEGVAIKEK